MKRKIRSEEEKTILKKIGCNLKAERVRKNLSAVDVAGLTGLTTATIHYYEKGELAPSAIMIEKLADIYNCNINDFFILCF